MLDCAWLACRSATPRLERRAIEERERDGSAGILRERRTANERLIQRRSPGRRLAPRPLSSRYLRAARRTLGSRTLTVDLQGTPTDLLSWAEHYVNQLDPLHPRPPTPIRPRALLPVQRGRKAFHGELQRLSVTPGTTPRNSLPSRRRATTTQPPMKARMTTIGTTRSDSSPITNQWSNNS